MVYPGLIKGRRLALVVDASDGNLGFGRLQPFQESLQHLLEEQLVDKAHLFITTYGTNASCLWPKVRQVILLLPITPVTSMPTKMPTTST